MLYLNKMFYRYVQELLGETNTGLSINDTNSEQYLEYSTWEKDNFYFALAHYYTYRLELLYLFGDYKEAVKIAIKGKNTIQNISGNIVEIDYVLFSALAFASHLPTTSIKTRKRYLKVIEKQTNRLKIWAELNPTNFEYKYFILQAEIYRLQLPLKMQDCMKR